MLRRTRALLWALSWNLAVAGWVAAGVLAVLGARFADVDRLAMAVSGGATLIGGTGQIRKRVTTHAAQHRRIDRQLGAVVPAVRAAYEYEGRTPPVALQDEREQLPGADVVRLRPRGAHHSRRQARLPRLAA